MNRQHVMIASSLLSIILFSLHVTDDVVHGFDPWDPSKQYFPPMLVLFLYATLILNKRKSGLVLIAFSGLFMALMPFLHRKISPGFITSDGAFFFIWTLFALGASGGLTLILALQQLVKRRSRRGPATDLGETPEA